MRRLRTHIPVLALLLSGLVLAPSAHALTDKQLGKAILADYIDDQELEACKYSTEDLKRIRGAIPNDIDQYAPDLPEALDAAIARRASGACGGGEGKAGEAAPLGGAPSTSGGPGASAPAPTPKAEPGVQQAAPRPAATPLPSAALAERSILEALAAADDNTGTPAGIIGVATLIGLLVLMGALYAGARWWAWEPQWLVRLRHATAEAGWRASATWAEFTDFVRFGR